MSKQFWIFLGIGLAVVGIVIGAVWFGTKSAHLELTGKILKVRVLALGKSASLIVVDFRVTNPSDVPFVVSDVSLKLTEAGGKNDEGSAASRGDIDNVFAAQRLIGPHFNDVLGLRDRIAPHKTLDRMTAARFEVPESEVNTRKSIVLHLEDVDGAMADLTETP
ncbi:MAG TPA: hypothetical protein VI756_06390 [Blastocatellia bacterium]